MFKAALRSTGHVCTTPFRALSVSARRASDHPSQPEIYGPGIKPGEVPTDEAQATGLERFELLAEMEGLEAFDTEPLDASRVGTPSDPIKVFALNNERIIGCTGCPADSHDVLWFTVKKDHQARCAECGSVYALDFQGNPDAHASAHH
ncbi:COX5B-domain-containing protein [Heliocybe sulcata]|uniref:Cytochrome c oxidase subunit 4, mitochondrial n=1 Tax=Heliocybe sulcata TaxID=5364 RepID=A0A5C3N8E5_9AGAM|nr:COX5B-domain-containing protein [Heliocybe sulcata]